MAFTSERCGEPDVFGKARSQQPATERKYIGIIMFPAISNGSFIITQGRPDTWKFVSGDGGADARAVDNDAARSFDPRDDLCHVTGDVWAIGRLLFAHVIGAECDGLSRPMRGRRDDGLRGDPELANLWNIGLGDDSSH